MPSKRILTAGAIGAAVAGGALAGALLFTPLSSLAGQTAEPNSSSESAAPGRAFGHLGFGFADLDVAAETLGVTEDELREALADGKSIADVADEQGVDVQEVVDALVADATARIDDGVAELKEDLPELIGDLVERDGLRLRGFGHGHGFGPGFGRAFGHFGPGFADLDVAAEALGVTEDELRDAFADGSSIADVAEEEGVDRQKVVDALVADATARIDDEVADGDLAADDAAELKEDLPERIGDLVDRDDFPGRGLGHFFGRR